MKFNTRTKENISNNSKKTPQSKISQQSKTPQSKISQQSKTPQSKMSQQSKTPQSKMSQQSKTPQPKASQSKTPQPKASQSKTPQQSNTNVQNIRKEEYKKLNKICDELNSFIKSSSNSTIQKIIHKKPAKSFETKIFKTKYYFQKDKLIKQLTSIDNKLDLLLKQLNVIHI